MGTRKAYWRSGTMLAGSIGAVFLSVWSAQAADLFTKAPAWTTPTLSGQAVDGFNAKYDAFVGELAKKSIAGAKGSWSTPFAERFGFQFDASLGKYDNRSYQAAAGHFFWRDPSVGLLGLYGSFTNWDSGFGQVQVGQVAVEAAKYWGRFAVDGIAGVEFGNSATGTVGAFVNTINIDTRFFDKINLSYYVHDNIQLFVGHRYLGGKNAAALGGEWAIPLPRTTAMASMFVEGRVGEFTGVWGGLKLYLGQKDKTLIRRHREDDPIQWAPESLATMSNQQTQTPVPPPPPPSEVPG